ncbi:uncharacterized protein PV09_04107 [Verruconis gallopava]|uniref:SAC domain-containing protein n=1 Tax=Verruconis gallopava TaxID=253628 RepID=A0A0D1YW79_9PEZI|nr:uncharacterized protein PV09_04107 [Verruconis gallopava]KIW04942.1 hypothetical protein PV09_04107 [Verruconis gallopava]
MPGLVRKLLIFAAVDGLVLQPAPPRNHKPTTEQAIKLDYKTSRIRPLLKDRREEDTAPNALEVHGIVGLLRVASSSYLISILRRELVAQIRGKPVYSIAEVALIPLSSQTDAEKAIIRARESQKRHNEQNQPDSSSDSEYDRNSEDERDDISLTDESMPSSPPSEPSNAAHKRSTSIAQEVIQQRGIYGRFTQKWFSRAGWKADNRRNQGLSNEEDLVRLPTNEQLTPVNHAPSESQEQAGRDTSSAEEGHVEHTSLDNNPPKEVEPALEKDSQTETIPLLPKLLNVTKMFFGSKNFYFSYDYDLSRSISNQPSFSASSNSIFRTFDPLFFWNRHLIDPFIDAGQYTFVLPLIQGFVGQRAFTVDKPSNHDWHVTAEANKAEDVIATQGSATDSQTEALTDAGIAAKQHENADNEFLLTLISRRSINRAGLRYLRRGVDEEGNVANSVETEQILSPSSWDETSKIYSFLQCRGSIPLFFSQSPYSLKPIVQTSGSWDQNATAFRLHFQHLFARYGQVQAVSLVEKHGNEAKIGNAYEKHANALNSQGGISGQGNLLAFEWFDFHSVCRGMRFENVSQLFDILRSKLSEFAWTVQKGDQIEQKQQGILRTNCMDCLDRTNVVQSACARNILEQQLKDQNITIDLQNDPRTTWFNSIWADNGDAISRQYAGTAALKGDFTRTRKRNVTGALNDFGLTLTRYYNNIVNDYFAQNVIDYILGRVDENIFIDFEADMKAQDYAIDMRKVRQNAIETCRSICIENESEDLVAGWTLSSPRDAGSLRTLPFEECVLLLTDEALYFCRMDWTTEKVRQFERIELEHITAIAKGVYITSTLAKREMDERKNYGFVLRYETPGADLVRRNTRSLGNEGNQERRKRTKDQDLVSKSELKLLAFKALPPRSSFVGQQSEPQHPPSEDEMINTVTEQIAAVANKARTPSTPGEEAAELLEVEDKDIISLADAKKSTGYLEQVGFALKKLVWA